MRKVGIDSVAVYTSRYALDLSLLAQARGKKPDAYSASLGQYTMSVAPPGEDIVTMAANAAKQALQDVDVADIELLLFATESGIDQSKSAGIYVHHLLELPSSCRVIELKQACYSATAGLQLAMSFLRDYPDKKVLLIASDVARYGLNTTGESSQGCAAAAMVLSADPRILALEKEYGVMTEEAMDFWRPNYMHEALVEGKYSSKLYLSMLQKTWQQYQARSSRQFADHDYFCYHTPVPRLVETAHQYLLKINKITDLSEDVKQEQIQPSLYMARQIGNSYAASMYIVLASLLCQQSNDLSGKRIGFYSYGSGCVAEYFSGVIVAGYEAGIHRDYHAELLNSRQSLDYQTYEDFYCYSYNEEGRQQTMPEYDTGDFKLTALDQHKRIYKNLTANKAEVDVPAAGVA